MKKISYKRVAINWLKIIRVDSNLPYPEWKPIVKWNEEKDNNRAQSLERQIDRMLCRLFQLSEDEIRLIELKASEIKK